MRRSQNLKKSPTSFNVYSLSSIQVGDFFKFLCPSQKSRTLLECTNKKTDCIIHKKQHFKGLDTFNETITDGRKSGFLSFKNLLIFFLLKNSGFGFSHTMPPQIWNPDERKSGFWYF